MQDFLKFLESQLLDFPMHVQIGYSKICDWSIRVYKKGCANDYPNSKRDGEDAIIVNVQDSDMELAFARAHIELKEWLSENCGGY